MARPRPKNLSRNAISNNSQSNISSSISYQKVNPWEQESDTVVNIRQFLVLAEQLNINTMADELSLASKLAELPSCRLISIQKDITAKRKSLLEKSNKLAACSREKETSDLVYFNAIESKINLIKELCCGLNLVLENRDKLIKRLQAPMVGDFLRVESSYHKYVYDTFNLLVPTLNEVSHHLDNFIWISNQDMASSLIEPLVGEVQSLTASLQTSYQTLLQMKKGLSQLFPYYQPLHA